MISYDEKKGVLYVGEITTSGYLGKNNKDFHIGAVKKVFEAFSKFYLLHKEEKHIFSEILNYYPLIKPNKLQCFFIVPKGARFINALGYRKKLFETEYMTLEEIELSQENKEVMLEVLNNTRCEMKNKR
ncbi:hypothetical protein [Clostridium sp. ZS2-4]|uniref:hypothetical protein n=1 Tax=Clostridium sp. ZS2-4 TaxID=2987703 RepID=UPI00227C24F7|nr:hypothetical protein [Clostridium sp. ZS2-4]MCY6354362.1 hypothetical protein [Clostridium sp. ZS2-4]